LDGQRDLCNTQPHDGNPLAEPPEKQFDALVRRRNAIVALALAAIWLPASSHALLQHSGLIHQIHAHEDEDHDHHSPRPDEHDADNHDAADGFCLSSTGKVEVPSPGVAMMPDWLEVPSLSALVIAERFAPHSGLSPPGIAPPELIHHWLFAFRALPARAPSLLS